MNIYVVNAIYPYEGERTMRVALTLADAMGTDTDWGDPHKYDPSSQGVEFSYPDGTRRVWERPMPCGYEWQTIYEIEVDLRKVVGR